MVDTFNPFTSVPEVDPSAMWKNWIGVDQAQQNLANSKQSLTNMQLDAAGKGIANDSAQTKLNLDKLTNINAAIGGLSNDPYVTRQKVFDHIDSQVGNLFTLADAARAKAALVAVPDDPESIHAYLDSRRIAVLPAIQALERTQRSIQMQQVGDKVLPIGMPAPNAPNQTPTYQGAPVAGLTLGVSPEFRTNYGSDTASIKMPDGKTQTMLRSEVAGFLASNPGAAEVNPATGSVIPMVAPVRPPNPLGAPTPGRQHFAPAPPVMPQGAPAPVVQAAPAPAPPQVQPTARRVPGIASPSEPELKMIDQANTSQREGDETYGPRSGFVQNQTALSSVLSLSDKVSSGQGTDWMNRAKALVANLSPDVAKTLNIDVGKVNDEASMRKFLAQIITSSGTGTNARLDMAALANPHMEMPKGALQEAAKVILGYNNAARIVHLEASKRADNTVPSKQYPVIASRMIASGQYDPVGFRTPWMKTEEVKAYYDSLKTQQQKDAFKRTYDLVKANPAGNPGVIPQAQ